VEQIPTREQTRGTRLDLPMSRPVGAFSDLHPNQSRFGSPSGFVPCKGWREKKCEGNANSCAGWGYWFAASPESDPEEWWRQPDCQSQAGGRQTRVRRWVGGVSWGWELELRHCWVAAGGWDMEVRVWD
jgi:hypothetical protein